MRRGASILLIVGGVLIGCGAAPQAMPVVAPVAVVEPQVVVERAVEAVAPSPYEAAAICAGDGAAAVRVHVEDVVLECADGQLEACRGENRFAVANCGATPVVLQAVRFEDPDDARRALIVEPGEGRLAPGTAWAWRTHVFNEQAMRMRVVVVDEDAAAIAVAERVVRVTNPTRAAAMAACVACDGVWGIQGLRYRDACNCRARDAGQACRDGEACEGACMFERWDISAPAQAPGCVGKKCPGRPAGIGRPIGRCSERVAIRGCHTLLQEDIADRPDEAVPWGVSRICID